MTANICGGMLHNMQLIIHTALFYSIVSMNCSKNGRNCFSHSINLMAMARE